MMMRLILLILLCGGASAVTHSLRYLHTAVSSLSEFPEYTDVGYVDDQQFVYYDSKIQQYTPRQRWITKNVAADYWDQNTQKLRGWESSGKVAIQTLMERTNQTRGIHTYQLVYGCELQDNVPISGFHQHGWDGRDFISFDKDRMVWVTPVSWGESTKNKWDKDSGLNKQKKGYLEQECIEWLKKYLQYGEKELKPVKPSVTLTPVRENKDLSCFATGFYPQAIEVNLFRDGVKIDELQSTGIRPNHDGSYQISKRMEFDPHSQAKYSCEVEHNGLGQKLVVFYEPKSSSKLPVKIGIVVALLLIVAASLVSHRYFALPLICFFFLEMNFLRIQFYKGSIEQINSESFS
ncbi:class I histocompatibility antigen, F10 alpha chain-like [Chiloscyllium plagiosum]|uniref:class I histocompatibility antigen, F10 alpha chain-like n=1 Tax=Chiloscyllium plagiosum TaxID=36176 RepID=UPI001CB7D40B|nr:class I histocompatibility antigen, F10 alpha chain-like [Chiloscyllium plagiosum]